MGCTLLKDLGNLSTFPRKELHSRPLFVLERYRIEAPESAQRANCVKLSLPSDDTYGIRSLLGLRVHSHLIMAMYSAVATPQLEKASPFCGQKCV